MEHPFLAQNIPQVSLETGGPRRKGAENTGGGFRGCLTPNTCSGCGVAAVVVAGVWRSVWLVGVALWRRGVLCGLVVGPHGGGVGRVVVASVAGWSRVASVAVFVGVGVAGVCGVDVVAWCWWCVGLLGGGSGGEPVCWCWLAVMWACHVVCWCGHGCRSFGCGVGAALCGADVAWWLDVAWRGVPGGVCGVCWLWLAVIGWWRCSRCLFVASRGVGTRGPLTSTTREWKYAKWQGNWNSRAARLTSLDPK